VSASFDRVVRWTRFDHVRVSEPVSLFVARWRAAHIRNLSSADLEMLRSTVRRWDARSNDR
jgi:hypothetical protein